MKGYHTKMVSLNKLFDYITEREGYQVGDTWILHAEEVISKLRENKARVPVTQDKDIQAIRAALTHIAKRPLARQIDAIYAVYHAEVKLALKPNPDSPLL
jgi:hypothetical protein